MCSKIILRDQKIFKDFLDQKTTLKMSLISVVYEIFLLKNNLLKRIFKEPGKNIQNFLWPNLHGEGITNR